MKAVSKLVATVVLLTTLATFPSVVIAFRSIGCPMTAPVSHFASSIQEAEYWGHAFGP